jgi:ankyrin repeat protein
MRRKLVKVLLVFIVMYCTRLRWWIVWIGLGCYAVKLLLENKAEVNSQGKYCRTPLSYAARKGHEAVIKLLLGESTNVEQRTGIDEMPYS